MDLIDSIYSKESESDGKVDSLIKRYNYSKNDSSDYQLSENQFYNKVLPKENQKNHLINCHLCNDNDNTETYIILECRHIFHIKCLSETQSDNMYNYKKMDDSFFNSMKCPECNTLIEKEELMYLHNKYVKITNTLLNNHQTNLNSLEQQLKILQDEIRTLYDYKHKLECDKEKSKSLVKTLITLID